MAESTIQKVRRLLKPTHDLESWYANFEALDAIAAVPILLEILNDNLETVQSRSQAATLLGMLRDTRAVSTLIETLRSPASADGLLRARAALALGQIGLQEERIVQALIEGLGDEDYFVRECSAKALGLMKRPEALAPLRQMRAADSVSTNREVAEKAIESIRRTD